MLKEPLVEDIPSDAFWLNAVRQIGGGAPSAAEWNRNGP
jgi:hypothetical protein